MSTKQRQIVMATIQNKLHVSEHSADGKLFAFLNSDGKLKIWNTDTNNLVQDVVPNYHLNAPFTCFTWINVNCSIGTQRKVIKRHHGISQTIHPQIFSVEIFFIVVVVVFILDAGEKIKSIGTNGVHCIGYTKWRR